MSDLIGKTIGPYRVLGQIGVGGMATVYKAYQPGMDRYVAIKVLLRPLALDEQFAKRFQREARAIAKLEHPHILPVFDYGEAEGITYIAMRYVEAGTLKERMGRMPLALDEIARIIGQIGGALDYAHRMGVIHRDVKPSNVLIDDQGNTYLTDFGLARMMETSDQLTASGVGVGTPAYMSPEQGQGIKVDHRSDIYSLGIMLYEMITGRVPYEAETPMAVMLKHITEPLPLPRAIAPDVPEAIERVILKALVKNPDDRFQAASEMVQALELATRKASAVEAEHGREDISFVTRLERWWSQPRGKAILIGSVSFVLIALGLLLSQLQYRIQIAGDRVQILGPATGATLPSPSTAARPTPTLTAPTLKPTPPETATPGTLPTAAPLPDFQLAFADSFDDDRYRWRPQEYAFGTTEITRGLFVLRPFYEEGSGAINDWNANYVFDDFDLVTRGSITENTGDLANTAYGIMFGVQSNQEYYVLEWSANGRYALWRLAGSDWATLIDWTFTGALKQGVGAENEVHLTLESGHLTIAFNGRTVAEKTLTNYVPGYLGLKCSTWAEPGSTCVAETFIAGWRQPQPVRVIAGCDCTQEIYEGQEMSIRLAWGTTTRRRAQDFIDAATPRVWIDDVLLFGGRKADLDAFWQAPVEDIPGVWAANWVYPYGAVEPGTHVMRGEIILDEQITDGYDTNNDGQLDSYGPGTLEWGTTELIVVTAPAPTLASATPQPTLAPTATPLTLPVLTDGTDRWRLKSVEFTDKYTVNGSTGPQEIYGSFLQVEFDCLTRKNLFDLVLSRGGDFSGVYVIDHLGRKATALQFGSRGLTPNVETSTILFGPISADSHDLILYFFDLPPLDLGQ